MSLTRDVVLRWEISGGGNGEYTPQTIGAGLSEAGSHLQGGVRPVALVLLIRPVTVIEIDEASLSAGGADFE